MSKNGNGNGKLPIAKQSIPLPNGKWIKKGQRNPSKKTNGRQREDRIQALAEFIMKHPFASRTTMAKAFCKKWECSWKTIEWSYVEPARQRVTLLARMTKEEARDKALGVVMSLMDHPSSKIKLRAVAAFARITGIEAPNRTELTGPGGGPIQAMTVRPLADLTAEELRQLAKQALEEGSRG